MRKKETAIQQAATDAGLDISLQDVLHDVEDELLVIDSEYRVRFANSAAQGKLQQGAESGVPPILVPPRMRDFPLSPLVA